MTRHLGAILALCLCLCLRAGPAIGQVSDALRDRVAQLLVKLDDPKPEASEAARKALVDLGPRIVPLLDEAKGGPEGRKAKVAAIRASLGKVEEAVNLGASRVTIQAKGIRLSEAIKTLQARTGNTINDLREKSGAETTNPAIDLDLVDVSFFEALDAIASKAGVTLSFYTGDGSIGLGGAEAPGRPMVARPPVVYSGPFRVELKEIGTVRDFSGGFPAATSLQFDLAWEPRLRPMLLAVKSGAIQAVTDEGKAVAPAVVDETDDAALSPENPSTELNVRLVAPPRSARELSSLKVKGEVTIPTGLKTFSFPSLAAKATTRSDGPVSVTLESTVVEEKVWKVSVSVAYPSGGPAFESYRQGLFHNRVWLQKADGSRFELNGGFNNAGGDSGRVGFEYLFVEPPGDPADYGLVYEAPSKVVPIPLEFEFKKVALP